MNIVEQSMLVAVGSKVGAEIVSDQEWTETTDLELVGEDDGEAEGIALPETTSVAFTQTSPSRARGAVIVDDRPWPTGVPRNYEELYAVWGKYVSNLIGRYNKVERNYEELVQWIWEKLLQSNLLEKYVDRLYDTQDTITNFEACEFVGLTWGSFSKKERKGGHWHKRMWRYYSGDPVYRDGVMLLNEDGSPVRRKSGWMPKILKGTWGARDAVLVFSDVVKLREMLEQERNDALINGLDKRRSGLIEALGESKPPVPKSTDANFAGYLRRAVRNHFCNFVRHKERKEKERLWDHFFTFTNRVAQNEGAQWEDLLVDEGSGEEAEIAMELHSKLAKIREFVPEHHLKPLFDLLSDGVPLEQAINRLENVTSDEKRSMARAVVAVGGRRSAASEEAEEQKDQRRKVRKAQEKAAEKTSSAARLPPMNSLRAPAFASRKPQSEDIVLYFARTVTPTMTRNSGGKATLDIKDIAADESFLGMLRLGDSFKHIKNVRVDHTAAALRLHVDLCGRNVDVAFEVSQPKGYDDERWELRVQVSAK